MSAINKIAVYCTTTLLHYFTTALLRYCTAALLHYYTIALLHCRTTALLHSCTAALLQYCTTSLLHYFECCVVWCSALKCSAGQCGPYITDIIRQYPPSGPITEQDGMLRVKCYSAVKCTAVQCTIP